MKIMRTLVLACLSQLFFFSYASAEISATLSLKPENPLPNSTVTITIDSYSFDVNTATITWKIDGDVVLQGLGKKSLDVKTGSVGDATIVTVRAETADGSSLEQRINIAPSSVILLYEAPKSYVPLLYPGRSLPSDGAMVHVSAIPQISDTGVPLSSSKISFVWYLNDTPLPDISGIGRDSADIRLDYMESINEIKVVARSPLGNSGTKTISIYPHPVMPILYQYDQILGTLFNTFVSKRFETTQDFSLILEPFYVSYKEQKDPVYEWYLNGLPSTPLGGRILSLHPKENSYGSKTLSIDITGPIKFVQKSKLNTEIIFDTRK